MLWILLILFLLGLLLGPQWMVNRQMRLGDQERSDLKGTGGELAKHLAERFALEVEIEGGASGDHYDPIAKVVRLQDKHFNGRTLSALTIAAHEMGHVIQDQQGYRPFQQRQLWAKAIMVLQRTSAILLAGGSLLLWVPGMAFVWRLLIISALVTGVANILFRFLTLPVEWHASYRLALPILADGYLPEDDLPQAERLLRAAALTYLAAALANLLNVGFWLRLLLRR